MRVAANEGHRLWSAVYDSWHNPLLSLESRTVQRLLRRASTNRVVDVGCGTGRWMLHFHALGAAVIGVDTCPQMLTQAKRHSELRGRLILGDAQKVPLANEAADLVICSFAASYVADLRQMVREFTRITAAAGHVVISDVHESALASGWSRSFRIGTSIYELEHLCYSSEGVCSIAEETGLQLEAAAHAHFDDDDRAIFDRAGKQHLYSQLCTIPAVWVGVWTKPCC